MASYSMLPLNPNAADGLSGAGRSLTPQVGHLSSTRAVSKELESNGQVEILPEAVTPTGAMQCGPIILNFRELSKGKNEIFVCLDGEAYRLRITRNNKLILTK